MQNFWEQLLLRSVGPLLTAVVGTLIIGTFVAWITRKAQERRADNQLQEERIHAENQLRLQLIAQMTEAASSLYMATQNFWRKKNREQVGSDELTQLRKELDQQYQASRVVGEMIEQATESLLRVNAGEEHTGLSVEQLRDQRLVLRTYRERLITGARAVMQEPIGPLTVEHP
jgi:hypothetical protein